MADSKNAKKHWLNLKSWTTEYNYEKTRVEYNTQTSISQAQEWKSSNLDTQSLNHQPRI